MFPFASFGRPSMVTVAVSPGLMLLPDTVMSVTSFLVMFMMYESLLDARYCSFPRNCTVMLCFPAVRFAAFMMKLLELVSNSAVAYSVPSIHSVTLPYAVSGVISN